MKSDHLHNRKLSNRKFVLAIAIAFVWPFSAQAQEFESTVGLEELSEDRNEVISSRKMDAANTAILNSSIMVSTQASAANEVAVTSVVELVEATQNTVIAPGVCLVINNYLADFCRQYPDDTSCNFL